MSQTKIIIPVVVVLILIGGYFVLKPGSPSVQNEVVGDVSQAVENNGKKMAFSEFIKQDGSYKCTVHQNVGGADTTGTTYVNNGMVRGEYSIKAEGIIMDSTMIVRDGYTYSWTSMAPNMGFKMKIVDDAATGGVPETSGTYSFNADQIGDYSCESWTVDASKFALPAGVTFKDVMTNN